MNQNKKSYIFLFCIIALVTLIDRLTKEFALAYLYGQEPITLIQNILYLQFAWNSGIAFGLFSSFQFVITLIVFSIILYILFSLSEFSPKYFLALGLLLGGAIGNLVDRVLYSQGVIDFISIPHFAIINIADIAITVGILLFIIQKETNLFQYLKKRKRKISFEY